MLRERDHLNFIGAKGGDEKAHTPVETPNNLISVSYAKVLVAVAEGELSGTPTGHDIYLNGTPLLNANGEENFGGVTWEWRNGTQDQTYIKGMPDVSNEVSVGVELTNVTPWVHQFTKPTLDSVRVTISWPALLEQKTNGDTEGYKIDYAIDLSVDGGPYNLYSEYTVEGKNNGEYERTHSVKLPEATTQWTVRVRRITPNSTSSMIQDKMQIKSYTEVVDIKQRYPNTALLFVQFDSKLFGGGTIPKISVNVEGRVIRIPTNYDPETRSYSGIWDGSFKWGYTNNPAWIFLDIVTQNRFGLGDRVNLNQVDRYELYEIAKYCDVMVNDGTGAGTKQPRHTCNMYIQSRAEAFSVIRDVCLIFNGMTYWDGTKFVASADKLEDTTNIPLFGKSDVIDGVFRYESTDERTIYTSALISYDEPDDHYGTQVEAVWEKSEILRWKGDRQTTLAAIGCTVRGEAQRRGKYNLLTNMRNRTVIFQTGLQGLDPKVKPGAIVGVADPLISGKEFTGRVIVATPTVITLDRPVEAKAGDILYLTLSDGIQQGRTVKQASGNIVTVTTQYSEAIKPNASWYLEASDLKSQLYKVIKITSPSEGIYEITGLEYDPSKFAAVDDGARLEPRPISVTPPSAQKAPTPITITANTFVEQTMAVTTMTISYPQTENAILYEGQWKVGQGDWVDLGTTGTTEYNVRGIFTGNYVARVRAINSMGIKSQWSVSETVRLDGKAGQPPSLVSFTTTPIVYGINLDWKFPNGAEDTLRTEIMYSATPNFDSAIKLGDFAYPQSSHQMNGLAAGVTFYFWARLVDRTGNIGPYFPLTTAMGVQGKSSTDLDEYDKYFEGLIGDSALNKDLSEKIEKIEVIEKDVEGIKVDVSGLHTDVDKINKDVEAVEGNVNWLESQIAGVENQIQNDISTVNKNLSDAITQTNNDVESIKEDVADLNVTVEIIQNQVSNIVDALEYDPKASYKKGDSVRLGQKLYQALKDVPVGLSPPNAEYWKDVGDIVTDLGALSAQVSTNSATITQQGNTITAQGQQLNALDTRVGKNEQGVAGNTTAINNLQTTVTQQGKDITAQGQAITAVNAEISDLKTGVSGNASAIESLRTTVTQQGDKITSQGQQLTSLGAQVGTLQTDVNGVKSDLSAQGTAISGLTTTVTQQGDTIKSHTNSITSLEGNVSKLTTDVNGLVVKTDATNTAVTNLTSTVTQQGDKITVQGGQITKLTSDLAVVTTDVNGLKTTVSAQGTAISNLDTKVTKNGEDISSLSTSVTKLTSDLQLTQLDQLYDKAETDQQITEALNIASGAASATQSLTSEVTKQGDVITAQGQLITELTASLTDVDGNIVGQAAAIESLKAQVTTQGNTITSQGQSITQLNNSLTLVDGKATNAQSAADKAQADATNALAQITTKADASAVTALTTRVSNAEGKITSQGESITQLNNSLVITNNNVTAAKKAADDAQKSADNALTQLTTKADASALSSLTTRVTTVEGTVTSQGQSITQLNNSLDTTNQNVTAAQNAAQAASDKAGSKGEVIYGSAAPTADKRLPQNLWIDTTNSNNTPKRWNGTAWVAVTDKVATDAAKAAADASALAQTKADSSTVSALTNTVTQQGDKITAQGQAITNLTASLKVTDDKVNLKADATTVTALTNTVTQQGKDITANTSSLTNLKTEVQFKELDELYQGAETEQQIADTYNIASGAAAATQRLSSSVTNLEGVITAQGQSITELQASLSGIDVNAMGNAVQNLQVVVTSQGNTIKSQGESITTLNNSLTVVDGKANKAQTDASNALTQVATKADASAVTSLTNRVTAAEGKITSQGESITQLNNSLTVTNQNVTAAQNAANAANTLAGGKGEVIYGSTPTVAQRLPQNLWIDTTGGANTPKRWNGTAWVVVTDKVATDAAAAAANALSQVATKAEASALNSLSTKVDTIDGKVTAQGNSITQLTTRITQAETGISANATAISDTNTKVTDIDGKLTTVATRVDGVYAQLNPRMAGSSKELAGNNKVLVGVWSEQSARIEGDVATGQRVDAVQVTVGENEALIKETSKAVVDLNGKASAMWSVKLQVNSQGQYVAAGIGLGIENGPAGLQSTFLVNADTFAVVNGLNSTQSYPFTVNNGQVFIRDAFIQNGSVNMLKIGDNLQSDDYVAGVRGWKLWKSGLFEINGNIAGQGRISMDNRSLRVYDQNNTLRVKLGDLS